MIFLSPEKSLGLVQETQDFFHFLSWYTRPKKTQEIDNPIPFLWRLELVEERRRGDRKRIK